MRIVPHEINLDGHQLLGVRGGGMIAAQGDQVRRIAARNASTEVQLVTPIITDLVRGQMVDREDWTRIFGDPITVDKINFEYPAWNDNNWMERKKTLRAECVPYSHSNTKPSKETGTVHRHSWACKMDRRTLNNADSFLNIGSRAAEFAARIVQTSRWFTVRDQVVDPANYAPGNVAVLAPGAEWDQAGGDPFDDIKAGIRVVLNSTGARMEDVRIAMPHETFHALMCSDAWKTRRGVTTGPTTPGTPTTATEGELAAYFGVGDVRILNPWGKDWDATALQYQTGPMFADDVFIFVPSVGGSMDDSFGRRWFMSQYRRDAGISSEPFDERKDSSVWFPWDEEYEQEVNDIEAGYLIRNTSSII